MRKECLSRQRKHSTLNELTKLAVLIERGILVDLRLFVRQMTNLGKTLLVCVQPGAKVDSSYYCDAVLNQDLLPDIQKLSGNNFNTFQQDGAPAHRSRQAVAFLHLHVPEFVEPENWLLNSPDLNPMDYSMWGALQQLVYHRRRIRDVEHQDVIDRTMGQFRKRLSLVVATGGGHIEYRFD